ncbi:MAG: DUF4468 domain-containing protein [Saprospiraceae bacterium]|nr:DUF4468 domain-containing protein [Saprospiraceae bacterium]
MKKSIIFLLALIFSSSFIYSQMPDSVIIVPIDSETKLITYKEVKEQKGTKADFYGRANDWFKSYYANPSGVTKIKDLEKGLMTGVARFRCVGYDKKGNKYPSFTIQYSLTIDLKDDRYRLTLSDFNVPGSSYFALERWLTEPKYNNPQYIDALNQLDAEMKKLIDSFHKALAPKEEDKDEW